MLVVDDEDDVLQFVSMILEDAGYDVECAISGADALDKVAAHHPDLMVLDLLMPGMDGWEVLRRVREEPAPPRVVILSAFVEPHVARREGAAAGVPKPFQAEELVRACSEAVR